LGNFQRILKLRDELGRKNLLGKIFIRKVSANAELVTDDLIKVMKELGMTLLGFGLESAAPNVLKRIKCNKVTTDDFLRTIEICAKYNIRCGASSVWGYVGETMEDMILTRDFIYKITEDKKNTFRPFRHYVCQPLPGSILWDICLKKGLVSLDMDFNKIQTSPNLGVNDWLYINEDTVPRKEFVAFRKAVHKEVVRRRKP